MRTIAFALLFVGCGLFDDTPEIVRARATIAAYDKARAEAKASATPAGDICKVCVDIYEMERSNRILGNDVRRLEAEIANSCAVYRRRYPHGGPLDADCPPEGPRDAGSGE